jgi:hypothetical protein
MMYQNNHPSLARQHCIKFYQPTQDAGLIRVLLDHLVISRGKYKLRSIFGKVPSILNFFVIVPVSPRLVRRLQIISE